MRAVAVNQEKKAVGLVELEEPRVRGPRDVRVRMLEVGVCGTDKEICHFQYGTPPEGSDYLVLGHESLGVVEDAGPDVTRVKQGQLVVAMVRRPCPHKECGACRSGHQDFCITGDFKEHGINRLHGFMTGRVVEDERYLYPVSDELRDIAVLTEPLTIAEKAIRQLMEIMRRMPWMEMPDPSAPSGSRPVVLVLGAGAVGLLGAMAFIVRGCRVVVYSREAASDPRAQLVAMAGADYVSSQDVDAHQLSERLGRIILVFEATGASQLSVTTLHELGVNGVFVFTGIPGQRGPMQVDADRLMRDMVLKNQMVFGTVNADPLSFENAIEDLQRFQKRMPDAVRGLITKRYSFEEYEPLLLGKADGIKNVLSVEAAAG